MAALLRASWKARRDCSALARVWLGEFLCGATVISRAFVAPERCFDASCCSFRTASFGTTASASFRTCKAALLRRILLPVLPALESTESVLGLSGAQFSGWSPETVPADEGAVNPSATNLFLMSSLLRLAYTPLRHQFPTILVTHGKMTDGAIQFAGATQGKQPNLDSPFFRHFLKVFPTLILQVVHCWPQLTFECSPSQQLLVRLCRRR